MSADLSTLRAIRERIIAELSDAFARGDLEMEDFDRRLTLAHRTDSPEALEALMRDVRSPAAAPLAPAAAAMVLPAPAPLALVPAHAEESAFSIMGSVVRSGQWTPPRLLRVLSVMGSIELDFREASLAPGVSELIVNTIMGSVDIIVPPTLAVEMQGSAIMGSFEFAQRTPVAPDPECPILRVHGVSFMGAVTIKTRLPGESGMDAFFRRRREKKALRERAKAGLLPSGRR
ncbi:MAG TPA: LiaF domain-containing protein [Polyangiaceae bacterium]|jgi:hypothetical protein